ncbi:hypothetical protein PsorP6_009200 [Peronosclerospora sorghi]|uniref:Uncharacterized protein n=1 Tax=Peronosclerospora sorghi TaxID=230839 RepID=A0ACC0VZU4_9STRA|nr:hypothetical protein PsorP6_009200 [Peronosclerospora sorghi]
MTTRSLWAFTFCHLEKVVGSNTTLRLRPKHVWGDGGNEYGCMSLQAWKEWLKLQYHTADSSSVFGKDNKTTKIGGVATKHCWYIPVHGNEGKQC